MDPAFAPVLGALIGALAGVAGGWLTGYRQAALEREKWLRGISDNFANELRSAVKELTTELAKAAHSMCWLCWLANKGPEQLTRERIFQYDQEMHGSLPRISGLHAVIAGMDQAVHVALAPLVSRAIKLDAAIGEAGLRFEAGRPETVAPLAACHEGSQVLERELHHVVAESIKGYAVASRIQAITPPGQR